MRQRLPSLACTLFALAVALLATAIVAAKGDAAGWQEWLGWGLFFFSTQYGAQMAVRDRRGRPCRWPWHRRSIG